MLAHNFLLEGWIHPSAELPVDERWSPCSPNDDAGSRQVLCRKQLYAVQRLLHEEDRRNVENCRKGNAGQLKQSNPMQLNRQAATSVNKFMNSIAMRQLKDIVLTM